MSNVLQMGIQQKREVTFELLQTASMQRKLIHCYYIDSETAVLGTEIMRIMSVYCCAISSSVFFLGVSRRGRQLYIYRIVSCHH